MVVGVMGWFLIKMRNPGAEPEKKDDTSMLLIQKQIEGISRLLDERMQQSTESVERQFKSSLGIVKEVTEKLTKLDETNRQVVNFADQLKNFENILKNPKQRGILGEYFLESVLKNVLPPNAYQLQYELGVDKQTGKKLIPDVVIFSKEGMIPMDSKFSLENYNKIVEERDETKKQELEKIFKNDLKNRIDETSKYIRPDKGTLDFAFMFIPAEGIYYDLLVNQVGAIKVNTRDLIEYAFREKRVIIVSPTTFYAYLQTVLHGLRALKVEESVQKIRKWVEDLDRHIKAYESYFNKIGNNLGTTVNSYNSARKELGKVDKDVYRITGASSGVEVELLDKPVMDEDE